MKYLVMLFVCMALAFSFAGCDENKGDDVTTRACWTTVGEDVTFCPQGHHFKILTYGDVSTANAMLASSEKSEYQESQFRTICTVTTWELTDFGALPHKYWPFKVLVGNTWVNALEPITLTQSIQHCPKPAPRALWHPYSQEEIAEKQAAGDYDIDNPLDQGYWVYTEVECPCIED